MWKPGSDIASSMLQYLVRLDARRWEVLRGIGRYYRVMAERLEEMDIWRGGFVVH